VNDHVCPVQGCGRALGTTRQGDPWLMCRKHWTRLDAPMRLRLWTAYRSWQRLDRQRRNGAFGEKPSGPLLLAIAEAIRAYLDVRDDCIRKASDGESHQLEVAL
jgi:hypothetical protein